MAKAVVGLVSWASCPDARAAGTAGAGRKEKMRWRSSTGRPRRLSRGAGGRRVRCCMAEFSVCAGTAELVL